MLPKTKQTLFKLFVMLKKISNIVTVTLIENIVMEKALSLTFDRLHTRLLFSCLMFEFAHLTSSSQFYQDYVCGDGIPKAAAPSEQKSPCR